MAHRIKTISLAIGVEFKGPRVDWEIGTLRYLGTADELRAPAKVPTSAEGSLPLPRLWGAQQSPDESAIYGVHGQRATGIVGNLYGSDVGVQQQQPMRRFRQFSGDGQLLTLSDFNKPAPKTRRSKPRAITELTQNPDQTFEVLMGEAQAGDMKFQGDPWTMRSEFLSLKQDTRHLLKFLQTWGSAFRAPTLFLDYDGTPPRPSVSALDVDVLLPSLVWDLQKSYNEALNGPPAEWLRKKAPIGMLTHRDQFPYLAAESRDITAAIATTITIDHLNKVPFQKCLREDCRTAFEVRQGKDYCGQYCGHLESVRRNRRLRRESKTALVKA